MQPPTLDDGSVRLRALRDDDVPAIVDQCTDPEVVRWTTVPHPYTAEHGKQFVADAAEKWRNDTLCHFAVADRDSDEFLGAVDVHPDGKGEGELGFGLRPSARGRGVMSAALRQLIAWSFTSAADGGLGLEVLHWRAAVGNWASRRAAWSVGIRVEGTVRGLHVGRNGREDAWIGSIRRGEPLKPVTRWLDVPELNGDVVTLRRFRETDVQQVLDTCLDPETRYWLGNLPQPYTVAHALGYITSREEEHASGRGIYWCAADPRTDTCVGSFALMHIDTDAETAEVGYWVHPSARSRGVATAAVGLLVEHAGRSVRQGGLGLRTLQLRAAEANHGSRRVAEKAGFSMGGVQRQVERLGDGSFVDLRTYDLVLHPAAQG